MIRTLLLLALTSCIASQTVVCADGRTCPEGTECRALTMPDATICARPEEVAACDGLDPLAECEHADAQLARCYDGVCLPAGCGNLRLDPGEACDDANSNSGDGCSADCVSTEACGNGVVDLIKSETCDNGNQIDHDGCSSTCKLEQAHWLLRTDRPGARHNGMMAHDPVSGRVVMFGGSVFGGSLDHGMWTWDGTGWMPYVGFTPPVRSTATLSFDGKNIMLYGGGVREDTWIFDGKTWTEYTGPGPGRREAQQTAYDSKRKRVVVFSGFTKDDTWEWDGSTWTQVMTAHTPARRTDAYMAYDPVRERIVLAGGSGEMGGILVELADTWVYDGVDWTDVTPSTGAVANVYGGTAVFDPASQRVLALGGCDRTLPGTGCDDPAAPFLALAWDGSTWTDATTTTMPPARRHPQAVAAGERILMFGGQDFMGNPLDDTWVFDAGGWQPPPRPIERSGTMMERHDAAGHVLLFGGDGGQFGALDDTWLLGPRGWSKYLGAHPPATAALYGAYDPIANQVVTLGPTSNPQTWIWDGSMWSQRQPAQLPPFVTSFAFDGKHLTMFGRDTSTSPLTPQTWSWDGANWFKASPAHSPPARMSACVGYDPVRKQLVLFGGRAGPVPFGDTWTYDGVDWTEHVVDTAPLGRTDVRLVWNAARARLVLAGAEHAFDMWEWDGTTWSQLATPSTPPARGGFGAATSPDGTGTLIFAGALPTQANRRDDLWELRWDAVPE